MWNTVISSAVKKPGCHNDASASADANSLAQCNDIRNKNSAQIITLEKFDQNSVFLSIMKIEIKKNM